MSAFVVAARWTALPGQEAAVHAAIRALIRPSREEPGNLLYEVAVDPADPAVFFFYEQYRDEAAYREHGASEHFRRLAVDHAIPLLASRERWFYRTLESPEQG